MLFKYLRPERLSDLTACRIRFSQRAVFDDERELRPAVAAFGMEEAIRTFCANDRVMRQYPEPLIEAVIERLQEPIEQQRLAELTQIQMVSKDEVGVFCLCENSTSEQMWQDYASNGRGFLIAFDTNCNEFRMLREPGRIGKVEYSDEAIPYVLGYYNADAFFRKRTGYSFEREWRSIRLLRRLLDRGRDANGHLIFVSRFDPGCVREIIIKPSCTIQQELRHFLAIDYRYRHVTLRITE